MACVDFSPGEKKLVGEVLETVIFDVETEINHTDILERREGLKKRRENLLKCLEKLRQTHNNSDYSVV